MQFSFGSVTCDKYARSLYCAPAHGKQPRRATEETESRAFLLRGRGDRGKARLSAFRLCHRAYGAWADGNAENDPLDNR